MKNDSYSIEVIKGIVKGSFLNFKDNQEVSRLLFDSRKLSDPESTLFFAIPGKRNDGHVYLTDLYGKGVRNFVVSSEEKSPLKELPDANIILVKDVVLALQQLAAAHRKQFNFPVIGITGSNGKTIVKEWLYQLLEDDYKIVRSPKSFNSQIGVPLSVWQMNKKHNLGIFEAGISEPGEMENLEKVIRPDIGIFTNIGEAHGEGFLDIRHKVKEKLRLFINSGILICCKDYPEIMQSLSEIKNQILKDPDRFKLFTWSMHTEADLIITKVQKRNGSSDLFGEYDKKIIKITIPFSDDASIENAIHCWATMLYLKYDQGVIEERMANLGQISMRLELKDAVNNCSLINDSYNSDVRSLSIALDFLAQQKQHPKKTVILSDILQSGKDDRSLYEEVGSLLQQNKIDRLIGIGKGVKSQQKLFSGNENMAVQFFDDTDSFLTGYDSGFFKDETILLKGARRFQFERISKRLEQKIHKTVLEINLNAVINNLQVYTRQIGSDTKIMAMVKAFSYGSGSYEIANVLQYHRVDYLTVAYADEGVLLREAGITLPIMVMNPDDSSFESIIRHQLEPEIYSLSLLQRFKEVLQNFKDVQPYPIHLKLDTGMHRLGLLEGDLPELKKQLNRSIKIRSVFSHLAGSEDPSCDEFTRNQIKQFEKMSSEIMGWMKYPVLRHILNSAGIIRYAEAKYDMVRLGIGLYGVDTTETVQDELEAVSSLKSVISQIKIVEPGDSVGYNRGFQPKQQSKIGIVDIGYADGIDRRLGHGKGKLVVRGQQVPIVGNVCMDMCMVDLTKLKEAEEGDEVEIFGKQQPIQQLAKAMRTIPYEVFTGISGRVKRVYFQE